MKKPNRVIAHVVGGQFYSGPRSVHLHKYHSALFRWYLDHGVLFTMIDEMQDLDLLERSLKAIGPEAILVWNGVRAPKGDWRTIYQEQGWFAQYHTMYLDPDGVCGAAMVDLEPDGDLGEEFNRWREEHIKRNIKIFSTKVGAGGGPTQAIPKPPYVLVMGQNEGDTSLNWSPTRRMRDLAKWVLDSTSLPVVFRPHPSSHPAFDAHARLTVNSGSPLYPTIKQATAVVGLTSTTLLESALIGRPTVVLGKGVWPEEGVLRNATPKTLPGVLANAIATWSPTEAWPWINALRKVQVDLHAPDFSHPRNVKALLG
jgi:hypothetical protein